MLISCPRCNAVYDVDDSLLPEQGKKLRCAHCGNVWQATPLDAMKIPEYNVEMQPNPAEDIIADDAMEQIPPREEIIAMEEIKTAPEPHFEPIEDVEEPAIEAVEEEPMEVSRTVDPNEIFARLADQTQTIFGTEKDVQTSRRSALADSLGLYKKSNRALYFVGFFLIVFLLMFYARFEIVRVMPFMGKAYAALGIKATIPGYGLEFQNVTRREFEEDYIYKMEIKGFIANVSTHLVDVPVISIQMLDKDTNVLQTAEARVPMKQLAPEVRIPFTAVIVKPSSFTAYVLLSFVNE